MRNSKYILFSLAALMLIETSCAILLENQHTQHLYGKVIDQNGQPVIGADVTGSVEIKNGFIASKIKTYKTKTDDKGLFEFARLRGASLSASVSKPGYEIDYPVGRIGSAGSESNPNDRVIFFMWKLRGAEPMINSQFDSRVPYDGTSATFNLETARKVTNDVSDLKITLLRTPLKIKRGIDKYNWTVKIEIINGGLLEEHDAYLYFAPKDGYQSSLDFNMSSNSVSWNGELRRNFYFKNAREQYGRFSVVLFTDSERPDTGVTIEAWLNPSGSQNLEVDPSRLTRIWK